MKTFLKINIFLIFILSFGVAFSQSGIILPKYDYSKYPEISASLFIFDAEQSSPNQSYSIDNIVVMDNGIIPSNLNFSNPNQNLIQNASINFIVDLSLENLNIPKSRFQFAIDFYKSFIDLVDSTKIEFALTSFDAINYYNLGLNFSKTKFLQILSTLKSENSSTLDQAFIDKPAGAVEILTNARFKKFAVLVTDGSAFLDVDKIKNTLIDNNITPLILVLGKPASQELIDFTKSTSGYIYDEVATDYDIELLSKYFYSLILGFEPSLLTYQDNNICNELHSAEITMPSKSYSASFNYSINSLKKPLLVSTPSALGFSSVIPLTTKDLALTLTAVNSDITIEDFSIQDIRYKIVNGDITEPFVLPKDKSHNLTIRYTPSDSAITFTTLVIKSNACFGSEVYLTGGFPNTPPVERTIKLTTPKCIPNSVPTLIPGDTFSVEWIGLLPRDVIQLEYSLDNGRYWDTLASNIDNLKYLWTVPNTPTDEGLIRAIQLWPNNVGRTLDLKHLKEVNTAFFNPEGNLVITSSSDKSVTIWNANNGKIVKLLNGHTDEVKYAVFNHKGDRAASAGKDGNLILWDINSGLEITKKSYPEVWLHSVHFSNDDKFLLISCNTGCATVLNAADLSEVSKIEAYPNGGVCWYSEFSNDDKYIITAGNNGVAKVWDWKNQITTPYKEYDTRVFGGGFGNTPFANFNYDYSKVSVISLSTKTIYVFDFETQDTLYTLQHFNSSNLPTTLFSTSFYYNTKYGEQLLTTGEEDVRLWDVNTGTPLPPHIIKEHSKSVMTAVFNFDAKRILTASRDFTAKIWNLEHRDLQMDTTDCLFRIKDVDLDIVNVDFGDVPLYDSKDTLIKPFLDNITDFNFEARNLTITNLSNSFSVLSKVKLPFVLDTLFSTSINLQFRPVKPGIVSDTITLYTPSKIYKSILTGNGIDRGLFAYSNLIDFGQIEVGDTRDTVISLMVVNKGMADVNVQSITMMGPDTLHFRILNNPMTTTLAPNKSMGLEIRYSPTAIELNNGTIAFNFDGALSPLKIGVFGEGIMPRVDTLTLAVGNISANVGEVFELPIIVKNLSKDGIRPTITGITTHLRFNSSLLLPLDYHPNWFDGEDRVMKLTLPTSFQSDSVLLKIRFKANLGNDSLSNLTLENSSPIGLGKIKITEESGQFRLTGYCTEGGARLFDSEGKVFLKQTYPNPTNGDINLDFSIIEVGYTRIYVIDALGKEVKLLVEGKLPKGEYHYNLNINDLPSGQYRYVLETPSRKFSQSLIIQK